MVGKSSTNKCAKCGVTSKEEPTLTFHRFPQVSSKHGSLRVKVWAKYCFPEGDWNSEELLKKLHVQHKMICGKHFDKTSFTSSDRKRLHQFAIPTEAFNILSQLRTEPGPSQQENMISKDVPSKFSEADLKAEFLDEDLLEEEFLEETLKEEQRKRKSPLEPLHPAKMSKTEEIKPELPQQQDPLKLEKISEIEEKKSELPPKPKKLRGMPREELLKLSKEELVDRLVQAEAHIFQLKNIINRNVIEKENDSEKKPQKKYDFTKCHFRHILLQIQYIGWDYQGFVVQEDTTNTIEHHIFKALTKACLIEHRESSNYHRCGRTDKGVSAFGQVISLKIRSKHTPDKQNDLESIVNEIPYCSILNRLLPKEIRAIAWMPIEDDFSARFNCNKRQYKYYFPKSSLDIQKMKEATQHLLGSHDFRNLCKMDVGNGVVQFVREIVSADIVPVDESDFDQPTSMYYLLIEGNAFLWHQIRCMQAILLLIGTGLESKEVITQLLQCERKPQYNMAIDVPLNLFRCDYAIDNWVNDLDNLALVIQHLQQEWTIQNIKATMIKDCLKDLENRFKEFTKDTSNKIISYHNCLTQGVKPKKYVPLMKRPTCSSLDEKIEHYKKRRKVHENEDSIAHKSSDDLLIVY